MSKSIVLCDRKCELVDYFLQETDYTISVLVVRSEENRLKYLGHPRVKNVYDMVDLFHLDCTDQINYECLSKFKSTQLIVENALNRYISDYQIRKLIFYTGLNFWLNIFNTTQIDAVVIQGLSHGYPFDIIPADLAKSKNINSYNFENCGPVRRALYDNLNESFVEIHEENSAEIKTMFFYNTHVTENQCREIIEQNIKSSQRCVPKKVFRRLLNKVGGRALIRFYGCLRERSFMMKHPLGRRFSYNYMVYLWYYWKAKRIAKYLDSVSSDCEFGVNYVYFALHLEPEANLIARTVLDSQLVAIKMISDALPEGWYLYVKEHPQQNAVGTVAFMGKVINSDIYRSKEYYDVLKSFPNVKIVRRNNSSEKLINESKAVATISGTAAWEGVGLNKPVLIFGHRTPLKLLDDVFYITSASQCKNAINSIGDGYMPGYNDLTDVVRSYMVEKDEGGYRKLVRALVKDMNPSL